MMTNRSTISTRTARPHGWVRTRRKLIEIRPVANVDGSNASRAPHRLANNDSSFVVARGARSFQYVYPQWITCACVCNEEGADSMDSSGSLLLPLAWLHTHRVGCADCV